MAYSGFLRMPARRKVGAPSGGIIQYKAFPAPTGGWVTEENMANQGGGTARVLDDCFPELTGVRVRRGSGRTATLGNAPTESMFSYRGAIASTLFAASGGSVFNVTAVLDPLTPPDPVLTGLLGSYWSTVNFATPGGHFLIAVNGLDPMHLYDGSNWQAVTDTSTPISIEGVDTSLFSHVAVHQKRLYFVERDSLNVWFLPVGQLGGTAQRVTLAGVFKNGGSVVFTGTWSVSVGDGMNDMFVIVSSEGEVAVYGGSDPASADNWSLVNIYEMPRPMGRNGWMKAGGDLAIASEAGLISLSSVMAKDPAALSFASVSRAIKGEWINEAISRRLLPWEVVKWPERNMALVTLPAPSDAEAKVCYVVNTETGAWARYRNWDTRCATLHDGWVYFGTSDGRVMQAEVGGSDDGDMYFPTIVWNWDHLNSFGNIKTVTQARASLVGATRVSPQISVSVGYEISVPPPPPPANISVEAALWDVSEWDAAEWDSGISLSAYTTQWSSIGETGHVFAPQVQFTILGDSPPFIELAEVTFAWKSGNLIV